MNRAVPWLWEIVAPPVALLALVLVAWQATTAIWEVPVYLLPGPQRVAEAAAEHDAELLSAVRLSAAGAVCGLAASLAVGIVVGLVFSQSAVIRRSVYPYAIFLQTVPIVAIAPLVVMWFGYGFSGVVVVSFILSLFPIITGATAGLTSIDPTLLELFEVHNASRWQVLVKLRLPNAVPYLVTAAKISCGLSVIGAIVGEMYAGFGTQSFGLGYLIAAATQRLDTAYAFAAVLASTLLSIAIFAVVSIAGATILARWHINERRTSTGDSP